MSVQINPLGMLLLVLSTQDSMTLFVSFVQFSPQHLACGL